MAATRRSLMAVGGAGLLAALGQTQADAATTTTGTPAWFDVTDSAYNGGADKTGAADSTTAVQDAITAAVTAGGGVVYIPAGKYKITGTLSCPPPNTSTTTYTPAPVYLVGDGAWATTIDFAGSGDCIRVYDNTAWGGRTKWGGGVMGLTIDGSGATGTATGIHLGDLLQYELDVTVQNFTASGSIGVHLDNNYYWTEQLYGRIYAQTCASHVVFDWTSATASTSTGSFERCDLDIYVNQGHAAYDGVVFQNGAFTGNSSLKIRGNFGASSAKVTSAALRLSATSTIAESLLDIGVECASGTYPPQTIVFGAAKTPAIIDCYGSLNFGLAGTTFAASNNIGNISNFLGHVTGDDSLPDDGWKIYNPTNSTFAPGVTGHVGFRVLPTGSEVMVSWALDIATGTVMPPTNPIVTVDTRFAFTDNKIIPGNGSGGGLSGNVYAPAYLTPAGAFKYAGPAYTSSNTSWWFGQGVFTLYTG